jgi:hypothetical protein
MSFKEMLLIPKPEIERMKGANLEEQEKALYQIRKDRKLTKHERKTKFVNNLDKYLKSVNEYRRPMKIAIKRIEDRNMVDNAREMPADYATIQITELFPRKLRKKARDVYDKISVLPNVVEKSGNIVAINGRNLKFSLLQYIREMLSPDDGTTAPKKGFEKFATLLKDANIHLNSVPNLRYKFKLRQLKRGVLSSESDSDSQVGGGCPFKHWKSFRF